MYNSPKEAPARSGIYALCCPDSGHVRYIGQAKNIKRRFRSHVNLEGRMSTPCARWIKSLSRNGSAPSLIILELCEELDEKEKFWISEYGLENLYNITPGGKDSRFSTYAGADMPWGKMQSPAQYLLIHLRSTARECENEELKAKAAQIAAMHDRIREKGLKFWVWYNINLVHKVSSLRNRYSGKMSRKSAEDILLNG